MDCAPCPKCFNALDSTMKGPRYFDLMDIKAQTHSPEEETSNIR